MKRITAFVAGLTLALSSAAATLAPVQLLNPAGSTAGQAIVSSGPSSAPGWGTVTAGTLAPIAANTVLGNFTGSSAAPAAFAVANCSTANSALKYTSGTGLSCGTTFALTSGNLSQFASTTSAQLLGVLSDETGTGTAVFSISPALTGTPTAPTAAAGTSTTQLATTAFARTEFAAPPAIGNTTPNTGAFTTLSATGNFTPSQTNGIVGTTTNNNANAGSVGEFISANVALGSAVSLTASTAANVTSVSLTAGDWDCRGNVWFNPAGTTTSTNNQGWISTVSATLPTPPNSGMQTGSTSAITVGSGGYGFQVGPGRLSLSGTTTVYLGAFSAFGTSTNAAYGFIGCRRVR